MLLSVKTDLLLTVNKDEMTKIITLCMYNLVKIITSLHKNQKLAVYHLRITSVYKY